MSRRRLIRGVQTLVAITLAVMLFIAWRESRSQHVGLVEVLRNLRPFWLLVASVAALQEGMCGGLRITVLGRVLYPQLSWRTGVASEFTLMFMAGVTPGQLGAPVGQVATLVEGGMSFAAVAVAEMLTSLCTITFFLISAVVLLALRAAGLLVVPGVEQLDALVGLTFVGFGTVLGLIAGSMVHPRLLKALFRLVARGLARPWQAALVLAARLPPLRDVRARPWAQPGGILQRLEHAVDHVHAGFMTYWRRGKRAVALAMLLTVGFFWARFTVAYFILLGLGIPTTPDHFVTIGPPLMQIIIVQTLLNFALYLSPTPGASGIAEAGSTAVMSPWVRGGHVLPYLVLWRILALFLCMFVGGFYLFRYLGTDVLERRAKEMKAAREAMQA